MSNRYKRRSNYDQMVITPSDEASTTIVHEDGKFKSVEDTTMDIDACWADPISRDVLINLYHGTDNFDNLMNIFKKSSENIERSRAEAEKRPAIDPFPYGDAKQKFIKTIINLRVLRLVMQSSNESVSSESTKFTLSPFGRQFVIKNIMSMIKDENFGLIVVMMSEKEKPVYLSHVIMKLMEMRKMPFDQLISIVDDLQPSVNEGKPLITPTIVDEYIEYLKNIEGEEIGDVPEIQSSVMRKLSTLLQKSLITVDKGGSYSLTASGDAEASKFWNGVKNWFYFMRDARLWTMDKEEPTGRFQVLMLPEGKELASSMKNEFENDDDRIAKGVMLDDVDEHEARAVLPVHQIAKKEKENKKTLETTIYIVEHNKIGFVQRIHENENAIAGGAIIFGVLLMVFGFLMTGLYPVEGMGILISSIFIMCMGGAAYQYTLRIVKSGRGRNKSEMKIIAEMSKQKLKAMEKSAGNAPAKKASRLTNVKCCFYVLAIIAAMIILTVVLAVS